MKSGQTLKLILAGKDVSIKALKRRVLKNLFMMYVMLGPTLAAYGYYDTRARKPLVTVATREAEVVAYEGCINRYRDPETGKSYRKANTVVLKYKHYCTYEIQKVLEGQGNRCGACDMTKRRWCAWYHSLREDILIRLEFLLRCSRDEAEEVLKELIVPEGELWLHILQNLYYFLFTIFVIDFLLWCAILLTRGEGGPSSGENRDEDPPDTG